MKRLFSAALLTGAVTATTAVHAGPLRTSWISAESRWLAHIDLDACRDSRIGQFIIEHREDLDIEFGEMEEMGIDPLTDFYNVTLFGVGNPEDEGIIIVQMNDSIDGLIEHAKEEADDFREVEIDGESIYVMDDGEMYGHVHRHSSGKRTVILSGAADRVIRTIKVIEGHLPDLTDADDAAIDPNPRDGAILYACAAGAPWLPDGDDPASQIVKLADGLSAQLGESGDEGYAEVSFSADTEENARNISDVVQGVVALGRLMASQENHELAHFRKVVQGLDVKTHDSGITIKLSLPVEELLRFAEMAIAEHRGDDDAHDEHDDDDDDHDDDDWDNRD